MYVFEDSYIKIVTLQELGFKRRLTTCYIYGLIDPASGELRYIGQTMDPVGRLRGHLRHLKEKTYKAAWIRKLLQDNVKAKLLLLLTCDPSNADMYEQRFIAGFRSLGANLTNLDEGGRGSNRVCSEQTKRRMSEAQKGKPSKFRGIPRSEETKKRQSVARKGRPWSERARSSFETRKALGLIRFDPAHMEKMAAAVRGKERSAEYKQKMSEIMRGRKKSVETRRKMSEAHKGRPLTEKNKKSLSAVLKGRIFTEETKLRMSEAKRGNINGHGNLGRKRKTTHLYYSDPLAWLAED